MKTYWVPYDNGGDADERFDSEEEAEAWIADCVENGDIHNVEAWQVAERNEEEEVQAYRWPVVRWTRRDVK